MSDVIEPLGAGRVEPRELELEMRSSFLDYAMSVIVSRALPDVRDGLKPVHRRVLWGMHDAGVQPNRPYKKSASIVGDVMGRYHPHGDQAIYDTLVRMAQPFSLRYPLVDGQGNFGSLDDDPPAAMRYCDRDTRWRLPGERSASTRSWPEHSPRRTTRSISMSSTASADPVRASMLFHSGEHPTLRVRTTEGFELAGTVDHPVLCLVDVLGVPMLLWKVIDEIEAGDRVVISRTPRPVETCALGDGSRSRRSCSAPSSPRGGSRSVAPASTTSTPTSSQRRWLRTTLVVGGPRYVAERVDRLRQRPARARRPGAERTAREPARIRGRPSQRRQAGTRDRLAAGAGVQASVPAGALHGRRLVVSPSPQLRSRSRTRHGASSSPATSSCSSSSSVSSRGSRGRPRGEIKVVITNRRDARSVRAKRRASSASSSRSSTASSRRFPTASSALSSDHAPFVADYIRSEAGSAAGRSRLARSAQRRSHRALGAGRHGDHGADRVGRGEGRHRAARRGRPLLRTGRSRSSPVRVEPVYSLRVDTARSRVPRERLRLAQHRMPAHAPRDGDAARHRHGHGRLRAELRRVAQGAAGDAGALPEPARQRLVRDRGRHGDEHAAAPPRRDDRRRRAADRQARRERRRPDEAPQGPRLPDRRDHRRPLGDPRRLPHRPRPDRDARPRPRRGAPRRQERDRRHRAAVRRQEGRRQRRDQEDRRPRQREGDHRGLRPRRPLRPLGDADPDRAQARRDPAGGAEQALQAHRAPVARSATTPSRSRTACRA